MYAIIESCGKQYKVAEGDVVFFEKLDAEEGKKVTFDKVILVSDEGKVQVGAPYVKGVKVEGKAAEAVPVNQYEARVNKNATSFELYVIPEDSKAKVQIDNNIEVTGTASATIPKNTDKAEVKIKVTAQDGTTEKYTLIVTNQSDDCKLAILKVDGEILEPDEQGKYHVTKKFLTESVEVEAIANNSYAQININTLKAVQEEQKATVTTPDAQNTITITVTAEDGTTKTYTLIILHIVCVFNIL